MIRPRYAILVITVVFGPALATGSSPDSKDALTHARASLARHDARDAVATLEATLPGLSAELRPEVLKELRRAYVEAIKQAESEGKTRDVADFREDLAILDRAHPSPTSPGPSTTKPTPPGSASGARSQVALPTPPQALNLETEPTPAGSGPKVPPLAKAEPGPVPLDSPTPKSTASPAPKPEPTAVNPQPAQAAPQPQPVAPDQQVKPASVGSVEAEPASVPASQPDLNAADAAFRAGRYSEAGQIYASLYRAGQLPELRHDAWAYCRMVAVVNRINSEPHDNQDWAAIQAEIEQIRRLSPKNWYAEYLRSLVAELSAKGRKPGGGRVTLRGGSPEEPAATHRRQFVGPSAVASTAAPKAPTVAPAVVSPAGKPGAPVDGWQVWETPNFRILHANLVLAQKAGQIAETVRKEQTAHWGSPTQNTVWSPRCDLYLYPTAAVFHERTGQPPEAPGFSTMGLNAGKVIARRVNLRADHPNLLHAVLPHEVTHVVLADLFTDLQIPRWADEGMAVLSEPASEQELRAADLAGPLAANRLFRLADLMTMDYPDGRFWSLYYAQSVSLTRFLVAQGTPAQFVEFVRSAQRKGIEAELKRIYKIDSFDGLQQKWNSEVRKMPAVIAAIPSNTTAETPARR